MFAPTMFPNFRHPILKHRIWPLLLAMLITSGPLVAANATADLLRKAEAALRVRPPSVTHKSKPAPGGNPNDYASTAPYFWPNPAKRDGLPYIRRDGEVNPESRTAASDHERAQQMNSTVATLARAYEATREEIQVMRMALMLERVDVARQVAETAKQKRIAAQIEPDGRQPKELERTKSFSYTKMNLDGLMTLANLAERVGVDLWHYQTKDVRDDNNTNNHYETNHRTPVRHPLHPRKHLRRRTGSQPDSAEVVQALREAEKPAQAGGHAAEHQARARPHRGIHRAFQRQGPE